MCAATSRSREASYRIASIHPKYEDEVGGLGGLGSFTLGNGASIPSAFDSGIPEVETSATLRLPPGLDESTPSEVTRTLESLGVAATNADSSGRGIRTALEPSSGAISIPQPD